MKQSVRAPWNLLALFLLFVAVIIILGYLSYEDQKRHFKKARENELSAIADLKVDEIVKWRLERFGDANVISQSPIIASKVQEWFKKPQDMHLKDEIHKWIRAVRDNYSYQNVILVDVAGNIRLSVTDDTIGEAGKRWTEKAVRHRKVIFSDIYRSLLPGNPIRIVLIAPLLIDRDGNLVPIGALFVRIDPHQFLYPLIQSWPTPSKTSETVLVRREGDHVMYLNELRHRKDTALTFRLPMSGRETPDVMAVQGRRGIVEAVDYRGEPVVAALRDIPDTGWFLVSKVDEDEIFAPLRERMQNVIILASLLVVSSGLSLGLLWRRQEGKRLRRSHDELECMVRERTVELKQRVAQLEAANKELGAFSYNVSHDLRAPLRAIAGFSSILLDEYSDRLDDEGKRLLGVIKNNTRKMGQLVDGLTEYLRMGRIQISRVPLNMRAMVEDVLEELKPLSAGRSVKLDIKDLPSSPGDKGMIRHVWANLISNAYKFSRPREVAVIEIGARTSEDTPLPPFDKGEGLTPPVKKEDEGGPGNGFNIYYVKDNGVGFDMRYESKLFNVFQHLHGIEEFEGSGIGLAIVKRIIEKHGGRVWAEGKVNEGATFYFSLPKQAKACA